MFSCNNNCILLVVEYGIAGICGCAESCHFGMTELMILCLNLVLIDISGFAGSKLKVS